MNIIKLTSQFQTTNENYWEELFMEEEQFNDCILPVLEEHGMSLLLDEVGYDKEDIYAGVTYQVLQPEDFPKNVVPSNNGPHYLTNAVRVTLLGYNGNNDAYDKFGKMEQEIVQYMKEMNSLVELTVLVPSKNLEKAKEYIKTLK